MNQRRRQFLTGIGTFGIGVLAGCSSDSGSNPETDTPSATPSNASSGGTPTRTPSTTLTPGNAPTPSPTATDTSTPVSPTTETNKLAAGDGGEHDSFGDSVAVSGDGSTAIIGAESEGEPNGREAGAAYVFSRDGDFWTQEAKLAAGDGNKHHFFGDSVAVSADGSRALIGAWGYSDSNGDDVGSAYVFRRENGSWLQETKLAASDGDGSDLFGAAVGIAGDGTTAIIGARKDQDPHGEGSGSAYVFSRDGESWTEDAKVTAGDGDEGDQFGNSVSMSRDGSSALVGAHFDADPHGTNAGSAYVFRRADGSWTQAAKFVADDGDSWDNFGRAVSLSGDGATAIVGSSYDEDPIGEGSGSAYAFRRVDGTWTQEAKLTAPDGNPEDEFATSVALSADGSSVIIGTPNDDAPNAENTGSAYAFTNENGSWALQARFAAGDGDEADGLGRSVAVSNDGSTALLGAPADDDPNGEWAGSAYVF